MTNVMMSDVDVVAINMMLRLMMGRDMMLIQMTMLLFMLLKMTMLVVKTLWMMLFMMVLRLTETPETVLSRQQQQQQRRRQQCHKDQHRHLQQH